MMNESKQFEILISCVFMGFRQYTILSVHRCPVGKLYMHHITHDERQEN